MYVNSSLSRITQGLACFLQLLQMYLVWERLKEMQQIGVGLCAITVLVYVFFTKAILESSLLHAGELGSGECFP